MDYGHSDYIDSPDSRQWPMKLENNCAGRSGYLVPEGKAGGQWGDKLQDKLHPWTLDQRDHFILLTRGDEWCRTTSVVDTASLAASCIHVFGTTWTDWNTGWNNTSVDGCRSLQKLKWSSIITDAARCIQSIVWLRPRSRYFRVITTVITAVSPAKRCAWSRGSVSYEQWRMKDSEEEGFQPSSLASPSHV